MPIVLKIGLNMDNEVIHVWKKFGFEIRMASCEFMQFKFFFGESRFDKPIVPI